MRPLLDKLKKDTDPETGLVSLLAIERVLAESDKKGWWAGFRVYDPVENPAHYQGKYGMESIDIIRNFAPSDGEAGFYWGNAIKYLVRYYRKNGKEDLKKARKNLDWLIDWEERNNDPQNG